MPTVNISPKIRFALYILGSLASVGISYVIRKGWAGEPERELVTAIVALLGILAASKVDLSGNSDQAASQPVSDVVEYPGEADYVSPRSSVPVEPAPVELPAEPTPAPAAPVDPAAPGQPVDPAAPPVPQV